MTPEWAYTGGTNLHGENEVMSCGKLRLKNGCWNYDMVLWSYAQQKKHSLKWLKSLIKIISGLAQGQRQTISDFGILTEKILATI